MLHVPLEQGLSAVSAEKVRFMPVGPKCLDRFPGDGGTAGGTGRSGPCRVIPVTQKDPRLFMLVETSSLV